MIKRISDFPQIEEIYRQYMRRDFARNELRPLSSLRKSWDAGEYECYGLYDEGELHGYAFFVKLGYRYMLDYLAVVKEYRDSGFGSTFLRELPDMDCVIVEVEDPEKAKNEDDQLQRERRMQFYLRNGFRETGVKSCVFGVDYAILERGSKSNEGQIREFYSTIYRKLLPAPFFQLNFKLT